VFDRGEYPGPALLGMLVAGVLVAGARRIGIGTGVTLLASAVGLVWYVALVFLARHTFYGLPTPEALVRIGRSIENAYDASLIDYAPVPVRPGYVMLTVAALWTATTIAEVATFRWRRPLVAALPCIGLFAFLSVVGTRSGATLVVIAFLAALLTFWAVESSHRLRSWGRWVAGIGGRGAGEASEVSSRLARRMGGACLAAAVVAPLFLPALGDGILRWRSGLNANAPFSGEGAGGQIDLLASLQPTLVNQSGVELFQVRSARPYYWRLASLVQFDGIAWRQLEGVLLGASEGISTEHQPRVFTELRQSFTIGGLQGNLMPAAVQPTGVEVTDGAGARATENVLFDGRTGGLQMHNGILPGLGYDVTSFVPDITYRDLRSARVATANSIFSTDPEVSPAVATLVERWTGAERTPADKLLALQARLREFQYSTDVERLASRDYLSQFLLESRTGYCQQFAAAFALIARHLGFPARVSVGFLPGETNVSTPGRFVVRGTHAHAWPEVLFEGYGWVAFEPTPRDAASPPIYTSPPTGEITPPNPFTGVPGADGVDPNNPQFLDGNQNVLTGGRDIRGGAGVTNDPGTPRRYAWQDTFANLLTVLILTVLVAVCVVPLLKTLRTSLSYRRAGDPSELVAAAFSHFEREARDLASGRRPAESAAGFARRMGSTYRVPKQPVAQLAGLYERAEYGPGPVPDIVAGEARALATHLRGQLWSSATWWARLRRLFSPKGLAVR